MKYSDFKDAMENEYIRKAYNIFKKKERHFELLDMYVLGGFNGSSPLVIIKYIDKLLRKSFEYTFYLDKWSDEIEKIEKEEI